MAKLTSRERDQLPDSAFAYVDSKGKRRLPINDEAHVKNALARFAQVRFESEAARDNARKRLLRAAKKYGIVPVGFMTSQLEAERRDAAAGRLVIELGRAGPGADLEERLREVLADPGLRMVYWSEGEHGYVDGRGKPAELPADSEAVTFLERQGKPMAAVVHEGGALADTDLTKTVLAALEFVIERGRALGHLPAGSGEAATLPAGFVSLLFTDIEGSTALLRSLGERYSALLRDVRSIIRRAIVAAGGREVDLRADEAFVVFERPRAALEAAIAIQRDLDGHEWPDDAEVRVRAGIHSGSITLTESGYIGLSVHTAARVCAAAHGGQILVSDEARSAVEDDLPTGVDLRGLGPHRLSGFDHSIDIYQVVTDGFRVDFPPLRRGAAAASR